MRLFLSSENLGNYPIVFLKMVGNGKLAVIENAKDDEPQLRKTRIKEHVKQLISQGFDAEELDLRYYFGKSDELNKKLQEYSGVFVFGGNTFILRRAMAASGFDKAIKHLLKESNIVYGGSSAGSCVCAKSLHGIEIGDRPQPDNVPRDYPIKETIWEGLGLVDFMVIPHYGSTWWGKEAADNIKYLKKNNLSYRILKDGQAIVIDGDNEEFLE
jgi:dipeptidase E